VATPTILFVHSNGDVVPYITVVEKVRVGAELSLVGNRVYYTAHLSLEAIKALRRTKRIYLQLQLGHGQEPGAGSS
jgi:hypothetical protein